MSRRRTVLVAVFLTALLCCNRDPEAAKQQFLADGNKYFEAGKFKEASILYRKSLQQDARFGEAYYRLALAELQLGRIAEAVRALERATELQPSNEDAFARLADLYLAIYFTNPSNAQQTLDRIQQLTDRAGRALPDSFDLHRVKGFVGLVRKDYQGAIQSFQEAHRVKPDDGPVAIGLAESLTAVDRSAEAEKLALDFLRQHKSFTGMYDFLYIRYFRSKRMEEAGEILEAKVLNNPSQTVWRLQLAMHHHLTGNRERRATILDELLASSNLPETHAQLGDFYMRLGEFDNALAIYRKGFETAPERRSEFQKKIVEALAGEGKTQEAFQIIEQVLAQNSKDSQALAMRGALRLRSGSRKELQAALSDLEAARAAMPENPVVRVHLGEAYLASGNRDKAQVEFEEAVRRSPDSLRPRYGLARVYMAAHNLAKVLAAAEEILAIRPDDLTAKMIRASAWQSLGKPELARSGFEEVLQQDAGMPEAVYRLAVIDLNAGKYNEAEAGFRKLVASLPADPRGTIGLAEVELARGHPDRAVKLVQARIDERPNDLMWRKAMGNIAARAGDPERALRELNQVLAREPDDPAVRQQVAHIYFTQRKYAEAAEHLRHVIKLRPDDPDSNLSLAMVLEGQGDRPQALRYYEKAVEAAPENPIALNNLAFILAETTKDLDRALALAQRARSRAPGVPDITDTLAWIYVKKNLNDSAIALLGDLVARHPDKTAWRYHLAMAYYQKGDALRARQELETALRSNPPREEESQIRGLLAKIKG